MKLPKSYQCFEVTSSTGLLALQIRTRVAQHLLRPLHAATDDRDRDVGWAPIFDPCGPAASTGEMIASYVPLSFRVDALQIHGGTLKMRQRAAELAWCQENHRQTMPRQQRKALCAELRRLARLTAPTTTKAIPVVWDLDRRRLQVFCPSPKAAEEITELFGSTFDAETVAIDPAKLLGRDDMDATGSLFLLWIWLRALAQRDDDPLQVALVGRLQLVDDGSMTATYTVDEPAQLAEACLAIGIGRAVAAMRLQLSWDGKTYEVTLDADTFVRSGVKHPVVVATAEDEHFTEELDLLEQLDRTIEELFRKFMLEAVDEGALRKLIASSLTPV